MSTYRVLIVKASALGDIIHALLVLPYLKSCIPSVSIDWVVEERFAEILRGHPYIDRLITIDTKTWRKHLAQASTYRAIQTSFQELRKHKYDSVFDLQGNLKSGLVTLCARSPRKIGLAPRHMQERINRLFVDMVATAPDTQHISDVYLHTIASFCSCEAEVVSTAPGIYTSPEDEALAHQILAPYEGSPLICLHQGTTWQTKFWHDAGWVDLAKNLQKLYPQGVVIFTAGTQAEFTHAQGLAAEVGGRAHALQRLPLKQFVAILKRADVVVGGDTGPVHLAAAVGTPTVSLYRASLGERSGPRGEKHICIQAPMRCTGCFKTSCLDNTACMESITPQRVVESVTAVLASVFCLLWAPRG